MTITNLGKYFFEGRDREHEAGVFSRGFASSTVSGKRSMKQLTYRTFTSRFASGAGSPVQVVLKKRDANNAFREVWSTIVDPKDIFIDTSKPSSPGPLIEIQKSGDPAVKVDFLILGDGYTAAERSKFEKDARRLVEILFATSRTRTSQGSSLGVVSGARNTGSRGHSRVLLA